LRCDPYDRAPVDIARVVTGLEAQARAALWQPAVYIPARTPMPDVSAAALANGMDDAESPSPSALSSPALPSHARVAAWTKRIKLKRPSSLVADESSGRIILRSLRAEM
jgi:hypothetical protein